MSTGHSSIPQLYAWGKSQWYEYLVLGPRIEIDGKHHTVRNLIALTYQMFDSIEYIHSQGIVHGDVKPDNFLFGLPPKEGRVHLIDFDLKNLGVIRLRCTQYHLEPMQVYAVLLPLRVSRSTSTTVRTSPPSIRSYEGSSQQGPSRRDDVESLAYTIAWLLHRPLPWYERDGNDVFLLKQQWTGPDICAGYPSVVGDFIEYARAMTFDEAPDYAYWRRQFNAVVTGLPGNADHDPSGRTAALVRDIKSVAIVHSPLPQDDRCRPIIQSTPDSERSDYSENGFVPPETWPCASSIHEADSIGDEESLVKGIERIVDLPYMAWPYTRRPEVMIVKTWTTFVQRFLSERS